MLPESIFVYPTGLQWMGLNCHHLFPFISDAIDFCRGTAAPGTIVIEPCVCRHHCACGTAIPPPRCVSRGFRKPRSRYLGVVQRVATGREQEPQESEIYLHKWQRCNMVAAEGTASGMRYNCDIKCSSLLLFQTWLSTFSSFNLSLLTPQIGKNIVQLFSPR